MPRELVAVIKRKIPWIARAKGTLQVSGLPGSVQATGRKDTLALLSKTAADAYRANVCVDLCWLDQLPGFQIGNRGAEHKLA